MKNLTDVKKDHESLLTQLFDECKLFWAFSDEQFNQSKTELMPGDRYVSIGAGGFLPKSKVQRLIDGQKQINIWRKNQIKKLKLEEKEILDALLNHECYYTCDLSDVIDMFSGDYTKEEIIAVYSKYKKEMTANM